MLLWGRNLQAARRPCTGTRSPKRKLSSQNCEYTQRMAIQCHYEKSTVIYLKDRWLPRRTLNLFRHILAVTIWLELFLDVFRHLQGSCSNIEDTTSIYIMLPTNIPKCPVTLSQQKNRNVPGDQNPYSTNSYCCRQWSEIACRSHLNKPN